MSNEPLDHHYVPAFYLKQWHDPAKGTLCEFRKGERFFGKSTNKSARATGFEKHLYSFKTEVSGQLDHSLETDVMKRLDNDAAKVLQRFLLGDVEIKAKCRKDWARFLVSLMVRAPEDIKGSQKAFSEMCDNPPHELVDFHRKNGIPLDSETVALLLQSLHDHERAESLASALRRMFEQNRSIELLARLKWSIRRTDTAKLPLMTSDRPVVTNRRLVFPDGYLFIPLSPSTIFIAQVGRAPALDVMRDGSDDEVMEFCNRAIVTQAKQYVWASNDRHEDYVKKWISFSPQRRFIVS